MKKTISTITLFVLGVVLFFSCTQPKPEAESKPCVFTPIAAKITDSAFVKTIDGKQVSLYTLIDTNGVGLKVTNFGARIVALCVPDKDGKPTDVVLGYNTLDEYLNYPENYLGAAIGRNGNRINNAQFVLDSIVYQLTKNENHKQLHGGAKGFFDVVWDAKQISDSKIEFKYLSVDDEEGYPGNLNVTMTYELTDNGLVIDYAATTDKTTVCNLTHHSYFNLSGEGAATINDHVLMIKASKLTPVDSALIPTGELTPVAGTPFDFNQPTAIGARVDSVDAQLKFGAGYDHNWVLDRSGDGVELVASIYSPVTGIQMDILTDQPGLQFYGGNFIDGTLTGKSGNKYVHRSALCLETQHFPDSPNRPEFPSVTLKPGENYKHVCVYKFSVKNSLKK